MCVSGRLIPHGCARRRSHRSLLDGDLASGAVAFAQEVVSAGGPHPKTRERRDKLGTPESNAPLLAAGRDLARKTRRNTKAAQTVIDAIEAAATLPFAEGCRRERALAIESLKTEEFKALVHGFFAERRVGRVPDIPQDAPRDIRTVPSSAQVPWAAESPWLAPTAVFACCCRTSARKASIAA
jgi:3-hydroxyacyl-CoA dehydrogenase